MKSFLVVALVVLYSQGILAERDMCAGSAAPFKCKCYLYTSLIKDPEEATLAMDMDPEITLEEFEPNVPGKHRNTRAKLLEWCTSRCMDRLRVRLLQENTKDPNEKKPAKFTIKHDGWNTMCDILFNPIDEITSDTTLVPGTADANHYWLKVARRKCEDHVSEMSYLGVNTCICYDYPTLMIQKCFATVAIGTYAGTGTLNEILPPTDMP